MWNEQDFVFQMAFAQWEGVFLTYRRIKLIEKLSRQNAAGVNVYNVVCAVTECNCIHNIAKLLWDIRVWFPFENRLYSKLSMWAQ